MVRFDSGANILMIWLRSLIFTLSFYALALFGCGIGFFIRSPSRRKAWILKFIEANGWCEKRILGLSYEIRGKAPETACLIAGGHQSLWECLKICSLYPGVKFVLKRELVEMPLVGECIRAFEHIPIDRRGGNKSLRQMIRQSENALKQGYSVLIFPQGTRVAPGDASPYLGGIGMLYERLKVPVVPMVVNSGVFWPRHPLKTKRPGKGGYRVSSADKGRPLSGRIPVSFGDHPRRESTPIAFGDSCLTRPRSIAVRISEVKSIGSRLTPEPRLGSSDTAQAELSKRDESGVNAIQRRERPV